MTERRYTLTYDPMTPARIGRSVRRYRSRVYIDGPGLGNGRGERVYIEAAQPCNAERWMPYAELPSGTRMLAYPTSPGRDAVIAALAERGLVSATWDEIVTAAGKK